MPYVRTPEMRARAAKTAARHGDCAGGKISAEWHAWNGAKHRCHDLKDRAYRDYGGRGITMCDRWRLGDGGRSGFECFLVDMGRKPLSKHSLDRLNNDQGYSPDNCRWATRQEQQRNRRSAHKLFFFGEHMTVSDLADWAQMSGDLLYKRLIYHRWSVGRALSQPHARGG